MEKPPRYPNRLGKNAGSYQGETVDIHKLLRDVEEVGLKNGWQLVPLEVSSGTLGTPRDRDFAAASPSRLPAFQKIATNPRQHLYISSGMHGDEPAGPLAVLRLLEENDWPENISVFLIPCFNPGGFVRNTRENEDGIDMNRDYRARKTALVQAHATWLEQRPRFDLSLCLHEDWEAGGFYLYELNPDLQPSFAEAIIGKVRAVCPIDDAPIIDGREASNGIICANRYLIERPDWPEAFYLIHHKTRLSYTLEGPSDFPLLTRVNALATGVRAVLEQLVAR